MTRKFLSFAFAIFAACTSARAATPNAYLHCTGSSAAVESTEHTIVIFAKMADVDGLRYALGTSNGRYAILEKTVASELIGGPPTLFDIDRVTGAYTVSVGVGAHALQESGHCVKVRRRL